MVKVKLFVEYYDKKEVLYADVFEGRVEKGVICTDEFKLALSNVQLVPKHWVSCKNKCYLIKVPVKQGIKKDSRFIWD